MYVSIFLFMVITGLLLKILSRRIGKKRIPGPCAYPIIGNLHLIGSKPLFMALEDLSKIYGKVFSMQLGSRSTIVLCDKKSLKEAFVKKAKDFAGRPQIQTILNSNQGRTGFIFSDFNDQFTSNRKMITSALHKFMIDQPNLQKILNAEKQKAEALFDGYVEECYAFYPVDVFSKIIPSIFTAKVFGLDVQYSDADLIHLISCFRAWFDVAEADNPADFIPLLAYLPNARFSKIKSAVKDMRSAIFKMISSRIELLKNGDFKQAKKFDAILDLMVRDDLSVFDDGTFSQEFELVIQELLGAGFDTSASTASWGVLYLIKNPEIVQKCREEFSSVSDNKQINCLVDLESAKKSFPYFMATLYEILRHSTVVSLSHKTMCDTSLQGYPVSKGTFVIANLHQINHDPDEWSEPEEFRPERFLIDINSLSRDNQQNESKANKTDLERPESLALNQKVCNEIATFSSGLRRCPGDKIALSMLYLLLGTLIQRYNFELVKPPEDTVTIRGLTSKPKHYLVKLMKI